ncbi:type III secretion system gatekeeper subunit SctW [Burkholderia ubonensis]|uniref:type III secretion system gatekeeper subunit SctW n=1 Tax=Burkholderia ubonensis TaxID=101571 RepID=UPI00075C79CB|nr:type III secretion system gatekeeper subunit SctW [Burkholderia ubonensis]KWK77693.1 type III secretion protein [Burkholderia ubonensis]
MSTIVGGASYSRRGMSVDGDAPSSRLDAEPSLDQQPNIGANEAAEVQMQVAEAEDDAADILAQFGRFRASERRTRRSDDFERILDSDADEKLGDLEGRLAADGGRSVKLTVATLLREARERFSDGSDMLLALRELRRRRRLNGEHVEILEQAMEELLNGDEGKRVKAGVNAALKAKAFGARMQLDPRRLRDLYRQFLEFEGSYLVVYQDWIDQFGARKRKRILDYVRAALTYDMHSLDPSCRCAAEFGPLISTLNQARALSSADELFIGRMLKNDLACDCGITEDCALAMMLGGLQRPFAITEVLMDAMGDVLRMLADERRSQLLQLTLRAFAAIPTTLYGETEARDVVVTTVEDLIGVTFRRERQQAMPRTSGH